MRAFFTWLLSFFSVSPQPPNPAIPDSPEDGGDVRGEGGDTEVEQVEEVIELPDEKEVRQMPSTFHWIIDRGHGRHTSGKRSAQLPDGRRVLEWQITNAVGQLMAAKLDRLNISYVLTPRNQENVGNALKERVDFANNYNSGDKRKVFVSIHFNAGPLKPDEKWSRRFGGTETWAYHNSPIGKTLSKIFQKTLVNSLGRRDRGIKSKPAQQFYVLRATNMPSVLTESMFYTHPEEALMLLDPVWQEKIAQAHVDAIVFIEKNGIKLN